MNTCCGTHVGNLLEIQMLQLLSIEKLKKDTTRAFFIAGGRVKSRLFELVRQNTKVSMALNGAKTTDSMVNAILKLQGSNSSLRKKNLQLQDELATILVTAEAQKFQDQYPNYQSLIFNKDYDRQFMSIVVNKAKEIQTDIILLVHNGSMIV